MKEAKSNIRVGMYKFTNEDIFDALRDAARRGVKLELLFDEEENDVKGKAHACRTLYGWLN